MTEPLQPDQDGHHRRPRSVLVVGGAGYLGCVLTRQLLDAGYRVRVFDRLLFGAEPLKALGAHAHLEIWQEDVRDIQRVLEALEGMEAVIVLAGLVGEPACRRDPQEAIAVNYVATVALAEACASLGIARLLFASTDSAYGIQRGIMTEASALSPTSLYARLKADTERRILALSSERFAPCALRMATLYGLSPRMRFDLIVNVLTMHAATRGTCTVHGGAQWRPLVHVGDAARAYLLALAAPVDHVRGQVFNVGSNEQNYQLFQLGELVRQALPHVVVETTDVPPDLRDYHVSFDKISQRLGFRARHSVAEGIREIYEALTTGAITDPSHERFRNA